jgi:hypothetical protein
MRTTTVRAALWYSARCATADVCFPTLPLPCALSLLRGTRVAFLEVRMFKPCWWCLAGRWGIYAYQYPLVAASAVGLVAASDSSSDCEARWCVDGRA